jgi:hypothetical protein
VSAATSMSKTYIRCIAAFCLFFWLSLALASLGIFIKPPSPEPPPNMGTVSTFDAAWTLATTTAVVVGCVLTLFIKRLGVLIFVLGALMSFGGGIIAHSSFDGVRWFFAAQAFVFIAVMWNNRDSFGASNA